MIDKNKKRAGYEYLLAYKLTVPIYDYTIDKLLVSLNEKHMREGGFTERLYRKRIEYRNKNQHPY